MNSRRRVWNQYSMHYNEIIFSFLFFLSLQRSYALKMEFANQIGLEMVDISLGIAPISQCVCLLVVCVCVCVNLLRYRRILQSVAININAGSKH